MRFVCVLCCVWAVLLANRAVAEPTPTGVDGPATVTIAKTETGFRLIRNGEPYFIKGVGGRARLEDLVAAGGNSLRTWTPKDAGPTLDQAHRLGLTVTVGIWLGHERHGFDYSNPADVSRATENARRTVLALKDHPAVLMWGIGNEMEGDGRNPKVWKTINDIARMIKEIDPHHPTMTVIAGVGPDKIRSLNLYCPDVDVVGINAYGDLSSIPRALREQGWTRPYVITEFGPFGWWQVDKTSWGAEVEPTSTQKAGTYLASYQAAVAAETQLCVGSYAFLWGHKQEHTRTWFGMFLPSGERTAAVDAMTFAWTGEWPPNRCPEIRSLTVDGVSDPQPASASGEHVYPPGTQLKCRVDATDPDGDDVRVTWELRSESTDRRSGGDSEEAPPAHPEAVVSADDARLLLQLPQAADEYRVFVYVLDGHGNAATANVPILVK
jgi:hypothetical protein